MPADLDLDRAEALVLGLGAAEPRRERGGVALDDQVDVGPRPAEQQVAHRAADQVDRLLGRLAHGLQLGVGVPQRCGQIVHAPTMTLSRMPAQSRTGMPSAAIRSFASRTR